MSLLLFKNKYIKKLIIKLFQYIQRKDSRIKRVEYIRGLYRYPSKMLGRKLPYNFKRTDTDVLVFAAHPDDDILGLGTTLYRHSLKGENIKVVFSTNGTGRGGESWNISVGESKRRLDTRYREAVQALSLINIPDENIYCLGYPDGGTQRYMKNMSLDILHLIQKLKPGRIYVHCIEGGHRDHDLTSYVVKSVCKEIGYSHLFEWTEYNPNQPLGTQDVKFLSAESTTKELKIKISAEERILKRKMLASHHSQDVEQFYLQGEAIRIADIAQLEIDLYEHSQFSKTRLLPIVNDVNKTLMMTQKKSSFLTEKDYLGN